MPCVVHSLPRHGRKRSDRRLNPLPLDDNKGSNSPHLDGNRMRTSSPQGVNKRRSSLPRNFIRGSAKDTHVWTIARSYSLRTCRVRLPLKTAQRDNETAAEMLSTSLSQRQDLLEGLDADAIMDYLTHHGVLDPTVLRGLGPGVSPSQRNSVIVRQVEEHGNTAVALFINALRQSGQLHLASSLDTEQRIKPVQGQGYFGKSRHKGEITVQIKVDALKILAPREARNDNSINASLLELQGQPDTLDDLNIQEDDDVVKPRSCWCFCFSRKSKAARSASSKRNTSKKPLEGKMYIEGQSNDKEIQLTDQDAVNRKDPNVKPHRTKSKEKPPKKTKEKTKDSGTSSSTKSKDKKAKSKSKSKNKNSGNSQSVPDEALNEETSPVDRSSNLSSVPDVVYSANQDQVSLQRLQSPDVYNSPHDEGNSQRHRKVNSPPSHAQTVSSSVGCKSDKGSYDAIVMEYDPQLELVKLRAGQEELASPTRQAGQIGILVEQWKSDGKFFVNKSSQLCQRVVQDFHMDIVKYFEQDRGTLVLDVVPEDSSILVFNICMKREQVNRLKEEVSNGSLLTRISDKFLSKVDLSQWDIRGAKFNIVLEEQHLKTVLSELS